MLVFIKQKVTSAVIINQLALTEALREMKHELFEKAIGSHHTCHASSLEGTFIKSKFITLIFYLTGLLPFRDSLLVDKKTDVSRTKLEEGWGRRKLPDIN